MEEQTSSGDKQKCPPYYEGKNVSLRVEEVVKILKTAKESDLVNSIPENPKGGDVYIFKALTDSNLEDWKNDGLRWKSAGTAHLPRLKKSLICKRMFTLQNVDGTVNTSLKREAYSWEVGEGPDDIFLVHYVSKPGETDVSGESKASDVKVEDKLEEKETAIEGQTEVEVKDPRPTVESMEGADTEVAAPPESETSETPVPENTAELQEAMKKVQAALASKSNSTPVMDVFNKLIETMVSNKDNPDLELCLVVTDKKSGQSSLTGSEEAKKIASTPETRSRSSKKRKPSTDEEEEGTEEEEVEEEKTPAKRPKRQKVDSTSKTAKANATPEGNECAMWNGKMHKIPVPKNEVFFSPLIVSNEEKKVHNDFFNNSHPKRTKEKYLKLRNHIINKWQKSKPYYLGMNHARKGLQKVGDVGIFRRIHKYLECKGVINYDARESDDEDEEESEDDSAEEVEEKRPVGRPRKQTPTVKASNKAKPGRKPIIKSEPKSERKSKAKDSEAEAEKEDKNEDKNKEVILSPSGRRKRNVATPNWADIIGGKTGFYKDSGVSKALRDAADYSSDTETVKKRGRPRKSVAEEDADENEQEKEEEDSEIVATPRGRGRPRKDGSASKVNKIEDNENKQTPRPRGRPRKSEISSVVKNQPEATNEGEKSARKRGRPRKVPVEEEEEDTDSSSEKKKNRQAGDDVENDVTEDGNNYDNDMKTGETEEDYTPFKSSNKRSSTRIQYDHICDVCGKGFAMDFLLKQHMKNHTKTKSEKLDGIEDDDDDDDDFEEAVDDDDIDQDYKPEKKIPSDIDNEIDEDQEDIEDKKPEKIFKKSKSTLTPKLLSPAFKRAVKERRPVCSVCGIVFLTHANLRKHFLLHSNKMYECPYCARVMKRKDYVVAHVRKCHKEIDLDESPIDFSKYTHFVTEDKDGEVSVATEVLDECDADMKDVKPDVSKPQTGLGKSVCPECMNIFETTEDLEQHMLVVHRKELNDATYKCLACKKEFKTLVSYQVHKLTHRKKEHDCPHCGAVFRTNSQLQVHKRHDHNIQYGTLMYFGFLMNNGRVTCEICSADFDSMADYHDHRPEHLTLEHLCRDCGNGFVFEEELAKHTETKCQFQNLHLPCGVCTQKFSMYDTRRKHVITNHKKTSDFYCHHCGACFIDMEALRTHFSAHKSERIFECEFCEKRFFEKRNLVDHRELHRYNKSFQCNICDRFYISSKSLQRHIKLHLSKDSKLCQTCDLKFTTNEELMRHMEDVHSTVNNEEKDNKENFEHKCNICGRKFLFKSRLVKHMQIHDDDKKPDVYQCPHCSNEFDTATMPLWKHMKQEHPEELKKKPFKKELMCEMCGFTTIHKQRLDRHMETHNPEKKFQCRYCDKKFQTTSSMLTHMIIHRGKIKKGIKKQSECSWPNCSKSFLKHSNMKRHLISHIFKVKVGKDWCDCKNCDKATEQAVFIPGDNEDYEFFEDDGTGCIVKIPTTNDTVIQNQIGGGAGSLDPKLVISNGGSVEGYESMDVLQEAIAQIEDIEKNASNAVVGEVTQATQTTNTDVEETVETVQQTTAVVTDIQQTEETSMTDDPQQLDEETVADQDQPTVVQAKIEQVEVTTETSAEDDSATVAVVGTPQVKYVTAGISSSVDQSITECIYECGVCDLMFETKCQVLFHLEEEHIDNRFPKCEVCNRHYIDKKNLLEHSTIHEGSKEFKCDVCSKSFRTKQCLRQHQYIHAEVKPFICSYCGHGFTQRGFFDEHVRRHTGDRPFRCVVCTKGFVSKNLLKIHMYSHTGNKPHKCQYCPKAFAENYQLVAHVRTHNDDRPFQCTECDKAFFVKPKLIRHMNTVHSIEKDLLSNYVPTRIGDGVGYRDRSRMKNYKPERKTQVVYIDTQGNIVSQEIKTEHEVRQQQERLKKAQKAVRSQQSSNQVLVIQPPTSKAHTVTETGQVDSFEVVTRRDSSGQIQVNTVVEGPDHVIIENDEVPMSEHVIMENTDGSETVVSIPETSENVVYTEMEDSVTGSSIELNGQNYTLVTQADGSQEAHLQLITQALAGVQGQTELDQGQIQVITEEIGSEAIQGQEDGSIQIYAHSGEETVQEGAENISINIGEDGTVDAADFEKIEALRNLYNDQPIVIVLESQQQ